MGLRNVSNASMILGCMLLIASSATGADNLVTGKGNDQVLSLGKIEVHGKPMVLLVLQMIKQGLKVPYSTDPKMADVVVCRLNDEAGSHLNQTLICATNRAWSGVRSTMQTAMLSAQPQGMPGGDRGAGDTSCSSSQCYSEVFHAFNDALSSLPGGYLHASVDGAQFRSLLRKIPLPVRTKAPTPVPPAGTRH
jgi:hypothetical protein